MFIKAVDTNNMVVMAVELHVIVLFVSISTTSSLTVEPLWLSFYSHVRDEELNLLRQLLDCWGSLQLMRLNFQQNVLQHYIS